MNLYQFHDKPEKLDFHDEVDEKLPKFFWKKYWNNRAELKKREAAIALDPWYAYSYAYNNDIQSRFHAGEAAIAKSPECAYKYARYVVRDRWPEGEDAISTDAWASYHYAANVLRGRFQKGEDAIAKDAYYAFAYARNALKGRFPKGEEAIKRSEQKQEYERLTGVSLD